MGEKIRTIGFIGYKDQEYEIEENESSSERIIHIQNESFRIEISESEYILMSALIIEAAENLRKIKLS